MVESFWLPRGQSAAKRQKTEKECLEPKGDPEYIVAWNVNGLGPRAAQNRREMASAIKEWGADVVFFSEVRLVAHYSGSATRKATDTSVVRRRSKPRRQSDTDKEMREVDAFGRLVHDAYRIPPVYSLATTREAGTSALLRIGGPVPKAIYFDFSSAAEALQKKKTSDPLHATSQMHEDPVHHNEGRIILMEFETIWLLHTYTPNNGTKASSFARRAHWETQLSAFVTTLRAHSPKGLVYLGDLNVAPYDADLSHPDWFREQNSASGLDPADRGQPGCTPRETAYFENLLQKGDLFDAFRELNPVTSGPYDIESPVYSWRGNEGTSYGVEGRFFAKGMRIDHALVSMSLKLRLVESRLLGHGKDRTGFHGSDHCPISLRLLPSSSLSSSSSAIDQNEIKKKKSVEGV